MSINAFCRRVRKKIRNLVSGEDGTATVEAVLWLPFFLAAFTFVADTTMVMHNQAAMMRVVQDANRALSIGKFLDENTTEDYIESALSYMSPNAAASTAIVDGIITTTVSAPAADLDLMGMFIGISSINVHVRAQQLLEE